MTFIQNNNKTWFSIGFGCSRFPGRRICKKKQKKQQASKRYRLPSSDAKCVTKFVPMIACCFWVFLLLLSCCRCDWQISKKTKARVRHSLIASSHAQACFCDCNRNVKRCALLPMHSASFCLRVVMAAGTFP